MIAEIDRLRASLGYAIRDPVRWQGLLRRISFARAIQASNSIEGYNVTVDDAVAAYEGEEPLDEKTEAWRAVVGYQKAMTYVVQLSDDPHFSYSTALIRSLHFMMLEYDLRKHPGRWRPGPISVYDERRRKRVYEGPNASDVPGLMDELVHSLNANDGGLVDLVHAALAHLNLVMIHPFSDGNGRMGRCLQTMTLARSGVLAAPFSSIEEYLGRNTDDYYNVLAEVGQGRWRPHHETGPWIRFCLKAHYYQVVTLSRRLRETKRLWDRLEDEIVAPQKLPDRVMFALADAAIGLRVRNATYRAAADISNNLASQDLMLLTRSGLLEAHGERKGRFYSASPRIKEIRREIREPKDIHDPFDEPEDPQLLIPGIE